MFTEVATETQTSTDIHNGLAIESETAIDLSPSVVNEFQKEISENTVQKASSQNSALNIQKKSQLQDIITSLSVQSSNENAKNAIEETIINSKNELQQSETIESDNNQVNSVNNITKELGNVINYHSEGVANLSSNNEIAKNNVNVADIIQESKTVTATDSKQRKISTDIEEDEDNLCSNNSDEFYDACAEPLAETSQNRTASSSKSDTRTKSVSQNQSSSPASASAAQKAMTETAAVERQAVVASSSTSDLNDGNENTSLVDDITQIVNKSPVDKNKKTEVKLNVNKIKSKAKIKPISVRSKSEMTPKVHRKKMDTMTKTNDKRQEAATKINERKPDANINEKKSETVSKIDVKKPERLSDANDKNRKTITNKKMPETITKPRETKPEIIPEVDKKPQVIVKTLFVCSATPSVIENQLETVHELQLFEANQTIETDGSAAEQIHPETDYFDKYHFQIRHPVAITVAEADNPSTSNQLQPIDLPSTSSAGTRSIESVDEPSSSMTEDSSVIPSSVSQTEDDEDEDDNDVEPMEPPLPVKADLARRARQFLAEGKLPNYYKAEMAVKLLDLRFDESEAIFAANECSDLYMAVSYLQQDCELCAGKFPMGKMVSMLNCVHRCCKSCAKDYFTLKIKERNILETSCPFCSEPDLNNDDIAIEYFNNLDIMLKTFIDSDVHELFQRKLRDRALMNEPNFRWCDKCGSGFIGEPNRRRIICPDCKTITCGQCNKPWERQHEGTSCQQFEEWKKENDPEFQKHGLESYLAENGINCPKCKFKYDLAKGGCMHFTCSQCKYEFCSGCGKAFKMAGKCPVSARCEKLGLHAHHPRNCLFYLRDKDPAELKKLLDEHRIEYDEGIDLDVTKTKCAVMEQREGQDGNFDAKCDREVEAKQAGLCRNHFVEYLVSLVCENSVDPVSIMDGAALEQEIRRHEKRVPERKPGELPEEYRVVLLEVVLKEIPLEENEIPYLARRPSKVSTYL
ncbi:hypothetical protein CHUAL_001917 [Chamberlinius hualienensis]